MRKTRIDVGDACEQLVRYKRKFDRQWKCPSIYLCLSVRLFLCKQNVLSTSHHEYVNCPSTISTIMSSVPFLVSLYQNHKQNGVFNIRSFTTFIKYISSTGRIKSQSITVISRRDKRKIRTWSIIMRITYKNLSARCNLSLDTAFLLARARDSRSRNSDALHIRERYTRIFFAYRISLTDRNLVPSNELLILN